MNYIENIEDILTNHVFGFHVYCLEKPFRITFASQSFCELLKVEQEKLVANKDKYSKFIHA